MDCFFSPDWRLGQRAALPVGYIAESQSELLFPYLEALLQCLDQPNTHNALRRNAVRTLQYFHLPEQVHSLALNTCFALLNKPDEAIAVRVFGMTVLANLCEQLPELAPEVRLTIEKYMPYGSAGYRSRGRKLIHKLMKLEQQADS